MQSTEAISKAPAKRREGIHSILIARRSTDYVAHERSRRMVSLLGMLARYLTTMSANCSVVAPSEVQLGTFCISVRFTFNSSETPAT